VAQPQQTYQQPQDQTYQSPQSADNQQSQPAQQQSQPVLDNMADVLQPPQPSDPTPGILDPGGLESISKNTGDNGGPFQGSFQHHSRLSRLTRLPSEIANAPQEAPSDEIFLA